MAAFRIYKEKLVIRTIMTAGLGLACALAQTSFEVASIKPAAPPVRGAMRVDMRNDDPGRVNFSNVSLRDLIRLAYQLKDYQIVGPDWLNTQRFDVAAKLPDGAPASQKPAMLQALLGERFGLQIHHELKELPAYGLMVAKGGSKLKEHVDAPEEAGGGPGSGPAYDGGPVKLKMGADGTPQLSGMKSGMMLMGMGMVKGQGLTLANLSNQLSLNLSRPVVDETGLAGKYDIALRWTPEAGEGGGLLAMPMAKQMAMIHAEGDAKAQEPDQAPPPLPVALQQQLGLRLEPRKMPVETLVVDRMEKAPTGN